MPIDLGASDKASDSGQRSWGVFFQEIGYIHKVFEVTVANEDGPAGIVMAKSTCSPEDIIKVHLLVIVTDLDHTQRNMGVNFGFRNFVYSILNSRKPGLYCTHCRIDNNYISHVFPGDIVTCLKNWLNFRNIHIDTV